MKTRCTLMLVAGLPIAVAHADQTLYALTSPTSPRLVTLDSQTGSVLTSDTVTGHEALFGGLAIDAAGDLYSIDGYNDADSDRLFRIDPLTGAGTVVGETRFNWNFRNVTVDPTTDVLYGSRDNALYTLDRATGLGTLIANITGPSLDQLTTFAINGMGVAYGTDIGETSLFRIDLATGAAEHLGNLENDGIRKWYNDLTFDENDVLWGAHSQDRQVQTIDIDTVQASFQFAGSYVGLQFEGGAGCPADLDGDGDADADDFFAYLDLFAAGDLGADIDGDGDLDADDFFGYLDLFSAGCP